MEYGTTKAPDESNGESGLELSDKERIRKLEAQVFQLKNVIIKLTGQKKAGEKLPYTKSKRTDRLFDFKMYKKRHVLLHVSYFGWNYHGFAVQETTGKTIESELFQALLTTKLIESRETSNYHRYPKLTNRMLCKTLSLHNCNGQLISIINQIFINYTKVWKNRQRGFCV